MANLSIFLSTVCLVLLSNVAQAQTTGSMATLGPLEQKAQIILKDLIATHPRPEVSRGLYQQIDRGIVYLSFNSDHLPPEMGSELVKISGKDTPVLIVNPGFVLQSSSFDLNEDRKYKQLILLHESVHLESHLSGRVPLLPPTVNPQQALKFAHFFWSAELEATRAEWVFAKEIKATHLLPHIAGPVKNLGEELGFLNGFYEALKASAPNLTSFYKEMMPVWEKLYQQELAKIKSKSRR